MKITRFDIPGPLLLTPKKFGDDRGHFMELFRSSRFEEAAEDFVAFVQDNRSVSVKAGTLRGLHYQNPPHAQGKLVRCEAGEILDIAVDFRKGSPTFGQHIKVVLGAETGKQFWVPPGFLHGFITREDNSVVSYKLTSYFHPGSDRAIAHDSLSLGIDWEWDGDLILSEKDQAALDFNEVTSPFEFVTD